MTMYTAICEGFKATGETKAQAINAVLPVAIAEKFGGWGQKVVSSEKIADYFLDPASGVRSNVPTSNFYDVYTRTSVVTHHQAAEDHKVYLEFKNPSPLAEHQAQQPVIKQQLVVSVS